MSTPSSAPTASDLGDDPREAPGPGPEPRSDRAPIGFFLRGEVDGWVRFTAWASLAANMLLILTGGLVRLTGSGLGCPTWPECVPGSYTPTVEQAEGRQTRRADTVALPQCQHVPVVDLRSDQVGVVPLRFMLGQHADPDVLTDGSVARSDLADQRRLPRSRGSDEEHEFPAVSLERDVVECFAGTCVVRLRNGVESDQVGLQSCCGWLGRFHCT